MNSQAENQNKSADLVALAAAEVAESLSVGLRELASASKDGRGQDELGYGLCVLADYEKLITLLEKEMHPTYRSRIDAHRKEVES